ncbi:3D domain-containing protein [Paraburkholderia xenovorans]|uniref:3D domain-containing protein n=1 Tax=Paraburkholderia xenovorans TaxID=36873 RepID=UPI0038B96C95
MSDIQSPTANAASDGAPASAPAAATSTAVGSGVSNPHPTSNVIVPVADAVLRWEVQNNLYGDVLPIIPSASTVLHGNILYQLKIKIIVRQTSDGTPIVGKGVSIKSNRSGDVIRLSSSSTGPDGTIMITLESRNSGELRLSVDNPDISAQPLLITLKNAWYEGTFLITGYNVCNESDFGGQMTNGIGLGDQHRYDFLFSASGVVMQGTGMALNGRYVRFVSMTTMWHLNSHGHRDHIQDPAQVTFAYTNTVQGSFEPVTENHSIAVDRNVIPPRAHVNIDGVGDRYADDRGSAIVGRHIDNFLGAGDSVVQAWLHGGVNGTQRRVKYIKD